VWILEHLVNNNGDNLSHTLEKRSAQIWEHPMKPPRFRCPSRIGLVCSLLTAGAVLPAHAASTREQGLLAEFGYALVMATGADEYIVAGQSQLDQSGSGLRLLAGTPQIQRVRLERYQ
jgi:hypothetical protein